MRLIGQWVCRSGVMAVYMLCFFFKSLLEMEDASVMRGLMPLGEGCRRGLDGGGGYGGILVGHLTGPSPYLGR